MFLRQRALARAASEKVLYPRSPGGDISLCVVYPNTYPVAMANLGFQAIYQIFESDPRVAADRAFLPEADELAAIRSRQERLLSFEKGKPLADFELIAFSISFETDYLNVVKMLRLAGIPPRRENRRDRHYPLIIAGGSAVFLNPEPIADFVDLFLIGEGEEMAPEFLAAYQSSRNNSDDGGPAIETLAHVEGSYIPEHYRPEYAADGRLVAVHYSGARGAGVKRRMVKNLNRFVTASRIMTEESIFGDMYLVEASRGCQWGCRFCAAGFMYRPIRYRDPETLLQSAQEGLGERKVIGLVGAEMASVPGVADLATAVAEAGGRLSPSSLKADCISPQLAQALARNGNRSVTIAPEAGSERMRKVINKNLTEAKILEAAGMLVGEGVSNLKLYFMMGLPEETDADVMEIARLTGTILTRMREQKRRVGHVTVSLNPFVPKPWTPFQWDAMQPINVLKKKIASLRSELGRIGGTSIELDAESPREAYFQALISRGDRRVGAILEYLEAEGCDDYSSIWKSLNGIRGRGNQDSNLPDPDFFVTRNYDHDELLPWDFIDHHIHKWFLLSERKKAHFEHQTKPCDVTRCTVCGAC
ncbi:MAG TPA: radical SAM protein [Candidatus Binataceae bacterium]|nr:radical SAM protein [Candidatus Binataceae bacterium]